MDMREGLKSNKSDQLNADDLLLGPKTITITEITRGSTREQPYAFHYEGDDGRPWKPCLSMRRVMAKAWGTAEGADYIGRKVMLYNDETVTWAGRAVGGIRIKALSHISEPKTIAITDKRGSKKNVTVEVLTQQAEGQEADLAASLRAKFESCASIDELRALWEQLPPALRETAAAFKDEAKQRLQGDK